MGNALKTTLYQKLRVTPQLKEAIGLLQLSAQELSQKIQEQLETNPFLDTLDPSSEEPMKEEELSDSPASLVEKSSIDISEDFVQENIWGESSYNTYENTFKKNYSDNFPKMPEHFRKESLRDSLLWQLNVSHFSKHHKTIALTLIDAMDDEGYLSSSMEDIQYTLTNQQLDTSMEEIESVLVGIQHFEPLGVGCRNLKEYLLLQLQEFSPNKPFVREATLLVQEYLALLQKQDYTTLQKKLHVKKDELDNIIYLIRSLQTAPHPQDENSDNDTIIPDVFVKKTPQGFSVELNMSLFPSLQVNSQYAQWITAKKNSISEAYFKTHLEEARWFIKSVTTRHTTLLKISQTIVHHQKDFLQHGESHMKPMILSTIAKETQLHESTISRAIQHKTMATPRGVFALHYFFSSSLATENGEVFSSTAVCTLIKKLIQAEPSHCPLSDHKIAQLLNEEQGISIARRTVAKYRESLLIPPSHERKHRKLLSSPKEEISLGK